MPFERILLFSDSHGSSLVMKTLLDDPPEGLTAVFHLGDGAEEAEMLMRKYPMYAFLGVKGNCDFYSPKPCDIVTSRGGVRFMLTHGHKYSVKSTMIHAVMAAVENGADLLLYGHTHIQHNDVTNTADACIRTVNPGSVRFGEYGVITVEDGNITVELKRYVKT